MHLGAREIVDTTDVIAVHMGQDDVSHVGRFVTTSLELDYKSLPFI